MHFVRQLVFFVATIAMPLQLSAPAFSANELKLSGTAALDPTDCAKGTSDPKCTINFSIDGKAAKMIYDGIKGKGTMQECTGNVEKFNGSGMHCIKGKTADDYICDFSYAFKKDQFGSGPDGC